MQLDIENNHLELMPPRLRSGALSLTDLKLIQGLSVGSTSYHYRHNDSTILQIDKQAKYHNHHHN